MISFDSLLDFVLASEERIYVSGTSIIDNTPITIKLTGCDKGISVVLKTNLATIFVCEAKTNRHLIISSIIEHVHLKDNKIPLLCMNVKTCKKYFPDRLKEVITIVKESKTNNKNKVSLLHILYILSDNYQRFKMDDLVDIIEYELERLNNLLEQEKELVDVKVI